MRDHTLEILLIATDRATTITSTTVAVAGARKPLVAELLLDHLP